jgi:hypothetical protein
MMEPKTITLQEQEYKAILDFKTLGMVQTALRKDGIKIGFQEIFTEVQNQNFAVVTELIIQSILRVHKQIRRESIEEKLGLDELENAFTFLAELIQDALPQDKKNNKKK